jgi:hypothetical protein
MIRKKPAPDLIRGGSRFSRLREAQATFFKLVQRFGGRRQTEKITLQQRSGAMMLSL